VADPPLFSFNMTEGSVVIILTIGLNWPMMPPYVKDL
jgi:hypothetical protein